MGKNVSFYVFGFINIFVDFFRDREIKVLKKCNMLRIQTKNNYETKKKSLNFKVLRHFLYLVSKNLKYIMNVK